VEFLPIEKAIRRRSRNIKGGISGVGIITTSHLLQGMEGRVGAYSPVFSLNYYSTGCILGRCKDTKENCCARLRSMPFWHQTCTLTCVWLIGEGSLASYACRPRMTWVAAPGIARILPRHTPFDSAIVASPCFHCEAANKVS